MKSMAVRMIFCMAAALAFASVGTCGQAYASYGRGDAVVEVASLSDVPDGYEAGGGVSYVFVARA